MTDPSILPKGTGGLLLVTRLVAEVVILLSLLSLLLNIVVVVILLLALLMLVRATASWLDAALTGFVVGFQRGKPSVVRAFRGRREVEE